MIATFISNALQKKLSSLIAYFLKSTRISLWIVCVFLISGCLEQEYSKNRKSLDSVSLSETTNKLLPTADVEAMYSYGREKFRSARAAHASLVGCIQTFIQQPTEEELARCQVRWTKSAIADGQLTYFYHLAQQAPNISTQFNFLQFRISARPIQPGYLDSFGNYPYSGLVHDIGFQLNKQSLSDQHGRTDVQEVVLGLFAMEYLLFGEDKRRSVNDFAEIKQLTQKHQNNGLTDLSEVASNRRRELLRLQANILDSDLKILTRLWEKSIHNSWLSVLTNEGSDIQDTIYVQTLEFVLTQHLVELTTAVSSYAEQAAIENGKDDNKSTTTTPSDSSSEDLVIATTERLQSEINAIIPIVEAILSSENALIVNTALKKTVELLAEESQIKSDFDKQKQLVRQAYQQLKNALDKTSSLIIF